MRGFRLHLRGSLSLVINSLQFGRMASFANLTEQICYQNELEIGATKNLERKTYIKGHHVYKDVCTPVVGEVLQVEMEPNNLVDKYAVCTRKDGQVVGHLKKGLRQYSISSEEIPIPNAQQ